jgi:hypothetical protein
MNKVQIRTPEEPMIEIEIPGTATFQFHHLVQRQRDDYEGWFLIEGVELLQLRSGWDSSNGRHVGTGLVIMAGAVRIPNRNQAKPSSLYRATGSDKVVAIGNGK